MFDIGFWEMGLIGVVALLVIGPERLPAVARTAGMWLGRARGFVGSVQADINLEVNKAEQLKRLLTEQAKIKSAHEIIEETTSELRESLSVPAAKPDYLLKAEPAAQPSTEESSATSAAVSTKEADAEAPPKPTAPTQASRAVAATSVPSPAPAKIAPVTPKESAKANDVKHDQSA